MRVIDIESITYNMRNDTQFVLRCEEVFHDKISAAAAHILSARQQKPLVALTGPSGSGKTTTAMRLKAYLENLGVPVLLVSMDNFFLDLDQRPAEAADDWESPLCVNAQLLADCLASLAAGRETKMPRYDFRTGKTGSWYKLQGNADAIIIVEGIHMLNPWILDRLGGRATGVYVAPRTRIITNDDRIVKPEQIRVARRLLRDHAMRGHSLRQTVSRAQSVDAGEQIYIAPYKTNAAVHIDTFHDYELCILAKYLREIPQFQQELSAEFMAEHHLRVLYDVLLAIPPLQTEYVPRDSLIREFVGGSSFLYEA